HVEGTGSAVATTPAARTAAVARAVVTIRLATNARRTEIALLGAELGVEGIRAVHRCEVAAVRSRSGRRRCGRALRTLGSAPAVGPGIAIAQIAGRHEADLAA